MLYTKADFRSKLNDICIVIILSSRLEPSCTALISRIEAKYFKKRCTCFVGLYKMIKKNNEIKYQ